MKTKVTEKLIAEAIEKHRTVKSELLKLIDRFDMYNLNREKIKKELFELYLKLK